MSISDHRLETNVIHAGKPSPSIGGAATVPIFQCSVFEHGEGESYHDTVYPRLSNLPNQVALGRKLAVLEAGEEGLVTASGMAAITTSLLTVLGKGGHLLVQDNLYGGTHNFLTKDFDDFGLSHDFIDAGDPASWQAAVKPNTRAIYVEAISNPLVQIADHPSVVAFARRHSLVSIIDNTFATPVNFRPLAHGYDLVVHSATKYLNGHSDLAAGVVAGKSELVQRIHHRLNHLGGSLDPHACFLLDRGLKTLVLRVRQHNDNALAIARHLAGKSQVAVVHYPGLESHAHHGRARELFAGFGGMLSFELRGGASAAERFMNRLELITHAPSLGGVESLSTRPVTTSHAGMAPAERERLGITDALIRVSVGIENAADIIADLDHAMAE
ncbi:MAG: aminotransferase class I/II-fold pyridoxal phosphate-dependent enzyme [Proteobacteria bacterium]|nr:aminotransferase class I/II-fold pyridoxal phosphate-dependent enzyme [Pseudomonadota bacterium]